MQRLSLHISSWRGTEGKGITISILDAVNGDLIIHGEVTPENLGQLFIGGGAEILVNRAFPKRLKGK